MGLAFAGAACGQAATSSDTGAQTGDSSDATTTGAAGSTSTGTTASPSGGPADSTSMGATDTGSSGSGGEDTGENTSSSSTGGTTGDTSTGTADSGSDSGSDGGVDLTCVDADAGSALGPGIIASTVDGLGDEIDHACTPLTGEDHVSTFTAPYDGVFSFSIGDHPAEPWFHTALAVIEDDCQGRVLGCNEALGGFYDPPGSNSSVVVVELAAAQTVLLAVTAPAGELFELDIDGSAVVADDTCIDLDLGSAIGPAVGAGEGPAHVAWTAPATATYTFTNTLGPIAKVFPPGCGDPAVLDLGGQMLPGPGAPASFEQLRVLDLVAGQTVAVQIDQAGPYALDIVQNATAGGTCCSPHVVPGCNNAAISAAVCAADGYCCGTHWDMNCSGAARYQYDANCIFD